MSYQDKEFKSVNQGDLDLLSDEEKNEFVKKCSQMTDGSSVAPTLDTNKEYNVLVAELEVVE